MKWSFVIQEKLKAAFLLGGIMALIVLISYLSNDNVNGLARSFNSIYKDRLMPAIDIIHLTEGLYSKRLLLGNHLLAESGQSESELIESLSHHDQKIDSLLTAYEQTYLVEKESVSFMALKNRIAEYALLEKVIVNFSSTGFKQEGIKLFEGKGSEVFQHTISRLNELTTIQSEVGEALQVESNSDISLFRLYSTIQILAALLIGVMIMQLIFSAKIVNTGKNKEFHMN